MTQLNPGSLYRCDKSAQEQPAAHGWRRRRLKVAQNDAGRRATALKTMLPSAPAAADDGISFAAKRTTRPKSREPLASAANGEHSY